MVQFLRLFTFAYGITSVGKPRTRWEDVVQRDALQILGIRGDELGIEKNGCVFWRRPGPRRVCSAIHGYGNTSLKIGYVTVTNI